MDPITAVGFAASILAFVEFSYEVITGTFEVIKSGSTSENAHVSVVVDDLAEVTKELSNRLPGYSKHDDALNSLASECQDLSKDLRDLLQRLKVQEGSAKWKSVRVALRCMWKKGDVTNLEDRLGKCRSQMLLRLVLILNERQISIQVQLNNAQSQSQKQASDAVKQLTNLRDDVLKSVEGTLQNSSGFVSAELSEQLKLIKEVRAAVNSLLETSAVPSPDMRILRQLYFNTIYAREDAMEKADSNTFEWILKEDSSLGTDQEAESDDEEEEDEESDEEFREIEQSTKEIRMKSRTNLLTWLRSGRSVFHISGKAGSGKSTLMKLMLDHPQTRVELRKWASSKQLVFSHFFFWSSGDQMQRSISGLYRSILFETLKQCPDLIRVVFPEAYEAFSRSGPGSVIDELFFRPQDLERGMEMLISNSPFPGHRMCFFIDGLDEYGEDGIDTLHHEKLTEQLESWGKRADIKILVSSRPHPEFERAFSDERRIRLHKLTKLDIFRFARNMFQKDKNFVRVRHCYKKLVNAVVRDSDGVFLWARLAIRTLIMATRRSTDIEFLEKQLESTPKSINDLYEQLLASINETDRETAFKMLLLVAKMDRLSAVGLTWLDNLDDASFPMSREIRAYTNDEIKERQAKAESQIEGTAKGLLEISEPVYYDEDNLFHCKVIQFFHRTLRDFVHQSKQLREFSERFPDFAGDDMKGRILLAELWFAKSRDISESEIDSHFNQWPSGESRDKCLDAYDMVIEHHQKTGDLKYDSTTNFTFCGIRTFPDWNFAGSESGTNRSFLHWVVWSLNATDYIRRRVSIEPELLRAKDGRSLILSAALTWENDGAMLRTLLELGGSPNEPVLEMIYRNHKGIGEWKALYCGRLEELLTACTVDPDCLILIAPGRNPRSYEGAPTHCISLKQLVEQLEPTNQATLIKLITRRPAVGILSTARSLWNYATSYKSAPKLDPQPVYTPYDIGMQPPPPENGNLDKMAGSYEYRYLVHSVKWGDTQLMASHLEIRLY